MTTTLNGFLGGDLTLEHSGPIGDVVASIADQISFPGRIAAGHEMAAAIRSLLDLDLGSILLSGWQTHTALRTAAQATVATPGSTEIVELASHRIRWTYQPALQIFIDRHLVYQLDLTLSVSFTLDSAVATVRLAHIVAVHFGRCDVTVALSWAGGILAQHSAPVSTPFAVPIGAGIPLLNYRSTFSRPSNIHASTS
jgi:hypothetical protein